MSAATLTLLRDLAEREASMVNAFPADTTAGHVNRAYHVGRTFAFQEAAEIVAAETDQPSPTSPESP